MTDLRKVTAMGGSAGVTLPTEQLQAAGIVDEDGEVADAWLAVDEVDEGEWTVRAVLVDRDEELECLEAAD